MNPLQILSTAAIFALSFHPLHSQVDQTIELEEVYSISQLGVVEDFNLFIPFPQDYDKRQQLKSIYFSVKPSFYTILDDSKYAVFSFDEPEFRNINTITIRSTIDLYDYDLSVAELDAGVAKPKKEKLNKFLKKSGLYKLKIENIDTSLLSAYTDRISKVYDIHEFVVNHVEYQLMGDEEKSAQHTYDTGRGDCTEYADLMVALCRYNNIPARRVAGITAERKDKDTILPSIFDSMGHAWVEVYFDEYGWIPFDPTHSDGSQITSFKNLAPKYVYIQFSEDARKFYWTYSGPGNVEVNVTPKAESVAGVTKR